MQTLIISSASFNDSAIGFSQTIALTLCLAASFTNFKWESGKVAIDKISGFTFLNNLSADSNKGTFGKYLEATFSLFAFMSANPESLTLG